MRLALRGAFLAAISVVTYADLSGLDGSWLMQRITEQANSASGPDSVERLEKNLQRALVDFRMCGTVPAKNMPRDMYLNDDEQLYPVKLDMLECRRAIERAKGIPRDYQRTENNVTIRMHNILDDIMGAKICAPKVSKRYCEESEMCYWAAANQECYIKKNNDFETIFPVEKDEDGDIVDDVEDWKTVFGENRGEVLLVNRMFARFDRDGNKLLDMNDILRILDQYGIKLNILTLLQMGLRLDGSPVSKTYQEFADLMARWVSIRR